MSGVDLVNFGISVSVGLYSGTVLNCSCILFIFSRKNVAKSQPDLQLFCLVALGFQPYLLFTWLMNWKSPLVVFLFSFIWFDMTCLLWNISRQLYKLLSLCGSLPLMLLSVLFLNMISVFDNFPLVSNVLVKPGLYKLVGKCYYLFRSSLVKHFQSSSLN